jgi:aldehyde dehydrogenase (NAD+)
MAEELTARLVERAKGLKLGNGLDPETDVGPVINEQQYRRTAG